VVDEFPPERELQVCIECRVDGTAPPSTHRQLELNLCIT
jgi:hypothetical protein